MSTIDISNFYDYYKLKTNDDGTINVPCDLRITQKGVPDIIPDNLNGSCIVSPTKLIEYSSESNIKCAKSFTPFTKNITLSIGNLPINIDRYNVCVKNCMDGSPLQLISPDNTYPLCKYKATVNYSWPITDENPTNISCTGGNYVTDEFKNKINSIFPNFIDSNEKLMCVGRPSEYTIQ